MSTKKLPLNEVKKMAVEAKLQVEQKKNLNEALVVINGRKTLIEGILAEKEGFLSKLGSKLGMSNPSLDVDDPKFVKKTLDKTLAQADAVADSFQASALNSTKSINSFHTAIVAAMDKVTTLADTLGPDAASLYQSKLIELVRNFYALLKDQLGRIESFQKTITKDLSDKGFDKRLAYNNTSGLKRKGDKEPDEQPDLKYNKNPASNTFKLGTLDKGPGVPASRTIKNLPNRPAAPANKTFRSV